MAKAIGIDLGTTNSAAGIKTLQVEIIPNREGELLTPSVVACHMDPGLFNKKERCVVGKYAWQWLTQDPENTAVSIKRLMGRNVSDPEVQRLIEEKRFSCQVQALSAGSDQSVAVVLNGKEYTPEELSSKIIQKIRADCEKQLGDKVEYAVVTVPAYFNDKQTHVTRLAAARAGLKVLRLLPEPTAAAISFGIDNLLPGETQTILVFDFGGGTFDISILTVRDGQFIEQGKGGDMWMGGDDIDALITHYLYQQTEHEYSLDSLDTLVDRLPTDKRNRFLSELKQKVEAAKIQLSERDKTVIEILGLLQDKDGDILDIEVVLTRQKFEELLLPFVDKAIDLVKSIISTTHFELDLIDQVVMVGGSSAIPLMLAKIKALFGDSKVLLHPRPMLAITEGAAIMAHRLADHYECPSCGQQVKRDDASCHACQFDLATDLSKSSVVGIIHTTSHDYFLKLEDGSDHLLAPKHTPLPFHTQVAFQLMDAEQNLAHFTFFNTNHTNKESIGDLWLSFILDDEEEEEEEGAELEQASKTVEVLLDFEIDENNIITAAASLKNRADVKVGRTLSRGKRDEQLFLELEQIINRINQEETDYYVAYEFLQRSIPLAASINQIIDPETGEENITISQQAESMLAVAKELLRMHEAPSSNGYYVESLLKHYKFAFSDAAYTKLSSMLNVFNKTNGQAPVQSILTARDELMQEAHQNHVAAFLKYVDDALDVIATVHPAQAPRLEQYAYDLSLAVRHGDQEGYVRLAKEIRPELKRIFSEEHKKKFHIWKELRV